MTEPYSFSQSITLNSFEERTVSYTIPFVDIWKFSFWVVSPASYNYKILYDGCVTEEKLVKANPIPILWAYSDKKIDNVDSVNVWFKNLTDKPAPFYLSFCSVSHNFNCKKLKYLIVRE